MPTGLGRSLVEVQRCPLTSGGPRLRSSGAGLEPAVPTDIGRMVVEVHRHSLGSGAGGSWQLRSSSAHCDQELARRRGAEEKEKKKKKKARRAILKSNNPHLAGGEQKTVEVSYNGGYPKNV